MSFVITRTNDEADHRRIFSETKYDPATHPVLFYFLLSALSHNIYVIHLAKSIILGVLLWALTVQGHK